MTYADLDLLGKNQSKVKKGSKQKRGAEVQGSGVTYADISLASLQPRTDSNESNTDLYASTVNT